MYTLNLLGPPQIYWHDQPIHIPRRQPRLLLYRIAASAYPLARQKLTHQFWPTQADTKASRLLTRQLSALRNCLPEPDLLLATPEHIAIQPQLARVDLRAFDNLPSSAPLNGSLQAMETVAADYSGPFLSGVNLSKYPELEQWQLQEQHHWEQRYLHLVGCLIDYFVAQADWRAAATHAHTYLAIDPTNDAIHVRLIELYEQTGQHVAAQRQAEQYAAALAQLGLHPAHATTDRRKILK